VGAGSVPPFQVKAFASALSLAFSLALGAGCAHAGAGTESDEEAAVAEGVRAALRLYTPINEDLRGPYCIEVEGGADFEQGVVAALGVRGVLGVAMPDCPSRGRDALLWVKVASYEWTDIVTHGTLDMRGTVETPPGERSNFRLSWWRASFHASLGFRQGQWLPLAADDLGRI
jgi:hypothetical protein